MRTQYKEIIRTYGNASPRLVKSYLKKKKKSKRRFSTASDIDVMMGY